MDRRQASTRQESSRVSPQKNEVEKVDISKFDLKKVSAGEVKEDGIYTWTYKAEKAGTTGRGVSTGDGYYDARPLCVILQIDKGGILALNTHYLENVISRGRLIWRLRKKQDVTRGMLEKMIHRYRIDRIKSAIYEVHDASVDARVLTTFAEWTRIKGK